MVLCHQKKYIMPVQPMKATVDSSNVVMGRYWFTRAQICGINHVDYVRAVPLIR